MLRKRPYPRATARDRPYYTRKSLSSRVVYSRGSPRGYPGKVHALVVSVMPRGKLMRTNLSMIERGPTPGRPQGIAPTIHERASQAALCIVGVALAATLARCMRLRGSFIRNIHA